MYGINDKIVVFDQQTLIPNGTIDWPWPETMLDFYNENNIAYIIANNPDLLNTWVNGDHLELREEVSTNLSSNKIINDGTSYIAISNLPVPSILSANNAIYTIDSSTFNFTTTESGPIWVQMVGKYKDEGHQIFAKSLPEFKDNIWEQVKLLRDEKIDAGVTVVGIGRFDTDLTSRTNINAAVTSALTAKVTGMPFSITWKLQNNVTVELDADQMIAVGTAVTNYTTQCHARSEALNTEIYAATSLPELDAINIMQGWP
jgi:hypothetical protein